LKKIAITSFQSYVMKQNRLRDRQDFFWIERI